MGFAISWSTTRKILLIIIVNTHDLHIYIILHDSFFRGLLIIIANTHDLHKVLHDSSPNSNLPLQEMVKLLGVIHRPRLGRSSPTSEHISRIIMSRIIHNDDMTEHIIGILPVPFHHNNTSYKL